MRKRDLAILMLSAFAIFFSLQVCIFFSFWFLFRATFTYLINPSSPKFSSILGRFVFLILDSVLVEFRSDFKVSSVIQFF